MYEVTLYRDMYVSFYISALCKVVQNQDFLNLEIFLTGKMENRKEHWDTHDGKSVFFFISTLLREK